MREIGRGDRLFPERCKGLEFGEVALELAMHDRVHVTVGCTVADKHTPGRQAQRDGGGQHKAPKVGSNAIARLVELARQELREKGLTEEQIERILQRRYGRDDKF